MKKEHSTKIRSWLLSTLPILAAGGFAIAFDSPIIKAANPVEVSAEKVAADDDNVGLQTNEDVLNIRKYAFGDCVQLKNFVINKDANFEEYAFANCVNLNLIAVCGKVNISERTFGYFDTNGVWHNIPYFVLNCLDDQSRTVMTQIIFKTFQRVDSGEIIEKPGQALNPAVFGEKFGSHWYNADENGKPVGDELSFPMTIN